MKLPANGGDQTKQEGLEVPCTYTFEGKPKMIKKLKLFSTAQNKLAKPTACNIVHTV